MSGRSREPGGFLGELYLGRLRWDLVTPFPTQDGGDRCAGDDAIRALRRLLERRVDPDAVDRTARLPDGVAGELHRQGLLRAGLAPGLGGLGLSRFNLFRMVAAAAALSVPVAMILAVENGFGLGPLLAHVRPGPLRSFIERRVRSGAMSGLADTEPAGASNLRRRTTATMSEDGSAYLLDGEKLFVSNATFAEHLIVSANVEEDGAECRRLLVVDTASSGMRIVPQDFMGIRGFPIGRVVCDRVRVPRERVVTGRADDATRLTPEAAAMARAGRVLLTAAPSLAIARQCVAWARDFVNARVIDGRPLGDYTEIQRRIAETAAEVFALETVAEWSLLAEQDPIGADTRPEQSAIKNIATAIGARSVERTMAVLAGEGYETPDSKRRRGAAREFPIERALRDIWAFRIAGGVDFQFDNFMSRLYIFPNHAPGFPDPADAGGPGRTDGPHGALSRRNKRHVLFLAEQVHEFPRLCRDLAGRCPDQASAEERPLILINRLANELLTSCLVLARAAGRTAAGPGGDAQVLADVYCVGARHRIADLRHQLAADGALDYRRLATELLVPSSTDLADEMK